MRFEFLRERSERATSQQQATRNDSLRHAAATHPGTHHVRGGWRRNPSREGRVEEEVGVGGVTVGS